MIKSIQNMPRAAKRRLQRVIRKPSDMEMVRRATAILSLHQCGCVAQVSEMVAAARSTIYRWVGWFEIGDIDGLRTRPLGRPATTVTREVLNLIQSLLESAPCKYGYLRSRWSSELLAKEIDNQLGVAIHASTVRRLLPELGFRYRRARPFLFRRDPNKETKLASIDKALNKRRAGDAVFYVDEVDINLNPKIGFGWRLVGKQELVPTPGQNEKRYIAGALNAHTGRVVWVESDRKNSVLFIELLKKIRQTYRAAKRFVLILDNVNIHSSYKTQAFLRKNEKFDLVFQPVYHPWVNRIERLWKSLHATVTRNHRHRNMKELMAAVRHFLIVVQPFPGAKPGIALAAR